MKILATDRLLLRQLTREDAEFIFALMNDPSWLRFIGDRGVRTLEDARQYILNGPSASYEQHGFGLYLTELKESSTAIGICGLLKRPTLADVDLGFAFLPKYWGKGYALEAAEATLALGKNTFGLWRVVAITSPENERSIKVLEKLGFTFEQLLRMNANEPEVKLFARTLEG